MENAQAEAQRLVVKIGGQDVDFTNYPPLTLGDRKKLREIGLDLNNYHKFTADDEDKLLLFCVNRIAPKVTEEQLAELPLKVAGEIAAHAMKMTKEVDSPFSTRSITSGTTTGGASAS